MTKTSGSNSITFKKLLNAGSKSKEKNNCSSYTGKALISLWKVLLEKKKD